MGNDDFLFCAGGGIMSHPGGPGAGVIALQQAAAAAKAGVPIATYANEHKELKEAMATFAKPSLSELSERIDQ